MSFLKIKDLIKRDLIIEEFLKTKKNIQEKFITERLGDISAQSADAYVINYEVPD